MTANRTSRRLQKEMKRLRAELHLPLLRVIPTRQGGVACVQRLLQKEM